MKTLCFILCLTFLSTSLCAQINDNQKSEDLNFMLDKYKSRKTTGAAMTIAGSIAAISGYFIARNGVTTPPPGTNGVANPQPTFTNFGYLGAGLEIAGFPVFCIGVPTWISGSVKEKQTRKALNISLIEINTPWNYSQVNSLGIKLSFNIKSKLIL